jgi:hypothetical protein
MVTCPSGHENREGRHFCGACGAPLVARPGPLSTETSAIAQAELHPQPKPYRQWDENKSAADALALATKAPLYLPNLIAGIAASVGVIVGSIGPWASVLAFTKNAIGADETYTLVLGAASGIALFTLLNLGRSNAGLRWLAPIAWSVSVVGLLCLLIAITDIADVLSAPTTDIFGATIRAQVEWGLWMVAISSAALFVTATVVAVQVRKAIGKPPTP